MIHTAEPPISIQYNKVCLYVFGLNLTGEIVIKVPIITKIGGIKDGIITDILTAGYFNPIPMNIKVKPNNILPKSDDIENKHKAENIDNKKVTLSKIKKQEKKLNIAKVLSEIDNYLERNGYEEHYSKIGQGDISFEGDFPYVWYGREIKAHKGKIFTKELMLKDQLEIGVPILNKTREIINYFNPKYFTIENPQKGQMKKYITDLSFADVDYCMYGLPYKKTTRIWNNFNFEGKLCNNDCGFMIKKKHIKDVCFDFRLNDRYRIPYVLIEDWISQF